VDDDPARISVMEALLDALYNPFVHSRFKLDAYSALAQALAFVSGTIRTAVRQTLEGRAAALELRRYVERGFFSIVGRPVDAQLGLIRLRAEVAIPLTEDDLSLLTVAELRQAAVLTRRLAVEVMSVALHEQAAPAPIALALTAQLYGRMFDKNALVRQFAASGCIYSGAVNDPVWRRGILQRAAQLIAQDQPGVGASLLRTLEEQLDQLRETLELGLLIETGKLNAHRAVRAEVLGPDLAYLRRCKAKHLGDVRLADRLSVAAAW